MSYILNALRKSEQERQAQQPVTVTDRILVNQPPPRHKTSKLIIVLIISNLMAAAAFFWFVNKESAPRLPVDAKKMAVTEKVPVKPADRPPVKMNVLPKPVLKKSEPLSRKEIFQEQPITKPLADKKPVLAPVKPEEIIPEPAPNATAEMPVEPVKSVAENKGIPYLSELDPEFRRTVPELKINVFVYSEQSSDRFVMIDMVKYTVGDRIKESVTLKEIRSDSLVVAYNNHIFRIKRP
jgi:general secretion pathway protein B